MELVHDSFGYPLCIYAFGKVYVTSLHKLPETGQTLSFLLQNLECIQFTHVIQVFIPD
ncbi:hypothetical protein HanRHA438_Chr09g0401151 [Helianthus annuus]|nr:hypothetical protein HanRHA438_Chr09g0401151 [Helianthus annuus]